jgi:hypothetical protein
MERLKLKRNSLGKTQSVSGDDQSKYRGSKMRAKKVLYATNGESCFGRSSYFYFSSYFSILVVIKTTVKMRYLILLLLLVFSLGARGQAGEESYGPRVLAVDSSLSFAEWYSSTAATLAPGYTLTLADKSTPNVIRHVFKNEANETLRFEYKYKLERRGTKVIPWVSSQKITGDGPVIAAIYNSLFDTNLSPDRLGTIGAEGMEVVYKNEIRRMVLEPDDYAPGYWTLAFY